MLLAFRFANHGAYRGPQEFSLRRARGLSSDGPGWDPKVSTVAAVYGANASGKSTFVDALGFFVAAVRESYRTWEPDGGVPVRPYRLDASHADESSEFEVELRVGGVDYQYGFVLSRDAVVSEWLYAYRTAHRTVVFERGLGADDGLRFGNTFRGERRLLKDAVVARPNALTLSAGAQFGSPVLAEVYRGITRDVRVLGASGYSHRLYHLAQRLKDDADRRVQLGAVLAAADVGVAEITVREDVVDPEERQRRIKIVMAVNDVDEAQAAEQVDAERGTLELLHRTSSGPVALPFGFESDGTQAFMAFADVMLDGLASGETLVIDEVDTSLHPVLVRALVSVFLSEAANPRQAQVVFTTHDASLLGRNAGEGDLLERDQVWLCEKDDSGAAELVGLSEYRTPRKEENLERGYLTGRYGGIPQTPLADAFAAVMA